MYACEYAYVHLSLAIVFLLNKYICIYIFLCFFLNYLTSRYLPKYDSWAYTHLISTNVCSKRQMQMIYLVKNVCYKLRRSIYTLSFFRVHVKSTEIENISLNRRGWSACFQHLLSIGKFDNWRQRGRSALFISLSALDRSLLGPGSRSLAKIYSRMLRVTHGSHASAGGSNGPCNLEGKRENSRRSVKHVGNTTRNR